MKFLKVNINYAEMLDDFLKKHPNYNNLNYDELCSNYFDECYWPSNFLEKNLSKLYNWDCTSLIFTYEENKKNNIFFEKWCEKYNIKNIHEDRFDNLLFQIIFYQPDVIYFHEIWFYSKEFFEKLRFLKPDIIIMGWDGAPATFPKRYDLKYVDIVFTCLKNKEDSFLEIGVNSKNVGHFFDFEILNNLPLTSEKKYDVIFAGTIDRASEIYRVEFLTKLIKNGIKLKIFAKTDDPFLKPYCSTPVYGKEYYNVLKSSKIVINTHAIADIRFSGNIRMYEATGLGCLLLTDYKEDLNDKFTIDKEVVSYKNIEEMYQKVEYFLKYNDKLEKIAKRGQEKTRNQYTYENFAKEVFNFVSNFKQNKQKTAFDKLSNLVKYNQQVILQNPINKNLETSKVINNILSQVENLNDMKVKLAIYGDGNIFKIFKEYFKNVVVVCDQKVNPNKNYKKLCHPTKLLDYEFDYIVILVLGREKEIVHYLENDIKIAKKKIILIDSVNKGSMTFFDSASYSENRYLEGGNSGAGSYNRLAKFKADVLNEFITKNKISTLIEFGCGDGNNLSLYSVKNYTGLDVSYRAIQICQTKFALDASKEFLHVSKISLLNRGYELAISFDVIYHLIEDDIFDEYMNNLFNSSSKYIMIYASNFDETLCTHVKHRKFTEWIERNKPNWKLKEVIKNRYPYDKNNPNDTSFADFYIFEKIIS